MLEASLTRRLPDFALEVEFKVDSQRVLVLRGRSGAGKTTLLQCLAGLARPSPGLIRLEGRVLYSSRDGIDVPARHRNIGYLFQDCALFPHLTVRQNVFYGMNSRKVARAAGPRPDPMDLLDSFGVAHLAGRYPRQLSGGEGQRVALARALAARPGLLLLDEPFSALDRETGMGLRREIKKIHREWGIPLILVSHHQEDETFFGGHVLTLEKGRVLA